MKITQKNNKKLQVKKQKKEKLFIIQTREAE